MKIEKFNEMVKKVKPRIMLELFMEGDIFLTTKQLQTVIDLKKGSADEGHGGANLKYRPINDSRDVKLGTVRTDLTVKCECGHSVFMPNNISKLVCNWCNRTVYNKNDLGQKEKFKDLFKKAEIKRRRK